MASSGYYNSLYLKYKGEAEQYEKYIKELEQIKESLEEDFQDEQKRVNGELKDLNEDLKKSVRHDDAFRRISAISCEHTEKTTMADEYLYNAVVALENEISSLDRKKLEAETARDEAYREYMRIKQQELQEMYSSMSQ